MRSVGVPLLSLQRNDISDSNIRSKGISPLLLMYISRQPLIEHSANHASQPNLKFIHPSNRPSIRLGSVRVSRRNNVTESASAHQNPGTKLDVSGALIDFHDSPAPNNVSEQWAALSSKLPPALQLRNHCTALCSGGSIHQETRDILRSVAYEVQRRPKRARARARFRYSITSFCSARRRRASK